MVRTEITTLRGCLRKLWGAGVVASDERDNITIRINNLQRMRDMKKKKR